MGAEDFAGCRWQDFEEHVLEIVLSSGFHAEFRKVFSNGERRFEIDVVAYLPRFVLCIDCKSYGRGRRRVHSLKTEAKKHVFRCLEFGKIVNRRCVPLLVTLLDDMIFRDYGCMIVPSGKFNYFLNNIDLFTESAFEKI